MTEPTARELLETRRSGHAPVVRVRADDELASRVEKVLALTPKGWAGWDICLTEVRRILNGEP